MPQKSQFYLREGYGDFLHFWCRASTSMNLLIFKSSIKSHHRNSRICCIPKMIIDVDTTNILLRSLGTRQLFSPGNPWSRGNFHSARDNCLALEIRGPVEIPAVIDSLFLLPRKPRNEGMKVYKVNRVKICNGIQFYSFTFYLLTTKIPRLMALLFPIRGTLSSG